MNLTPNHSPKNKRNNVPCRFDRNVLAGYKAKILRRYRVILSMLYVNSG